MARRVFGVMSKNKDQHVIPNCYLKDWCDPKTPTGQSPYIWRISKDGANRKNKSPEKSFTSPHRYTITLPNGERSLILENTLADLENKFVRIRARIRRKEILSLRDKAQLCLFAAAMQSRTIRAGDHFEESQRQLHEQIVAMEKQHGLEPVTSLETARMVETAHQDMVLYALDTQAPLYFNMHMSIFVTDDPIGFITSDSPCLWFDPQAHTRPPFYRSAGLIQPEIEVSLPLTPHHMLFLSHKRYEFYLPTSQRTLDEANRQRRFSCTEEFISWKGETRPYWFQELERPADAWENTENGKKAMKEQAEWDEMRKSMQGHSG